MIAEDMELQGIGAAVVAPEWLRGLIRAIRSEAIKPKDTRVKSLWDLLRQRQLLRCSPWLKRVLGHIWRRGLSAQPHPRTARRIVRRLRLWRILPPKSVKAAAHRPAAMRPLAPVPMRAVQRVAVKPVGMVRPVAAQPVRPVQMQAVSSRRGVRR